MKKVLLSVLLVVFAAPSIVSAEFKFSDLNPFKKKPPQRVSRSLSDDKESNFKLPSLKLPKLSMPKSNAVKPYPTTKPKESTLDKMSRGTKDFFSKSKETLMPWTKPKPRSVSGSRKITKKPASKGSNFLPFQSQPEEIAPRTVNDFLRRDVPQF